MSTTDHRRRRTAARIALGTLAVFVAMFALLDWCFPFPFAALDPPPARVVADRQGVPLRVFLPPDEQWRLPVALEEVSPLLRRAIVASEDRWFAFHPGVNPLAIVRAAWTNLRRGRVVSGASTITMQIARMAQPQPRTLTAKVVEAFRALQLGLRVPKDRRLEIYLNLTPYGGNVQGVGAASTFLFGKPPSVLSLGEVALLVALPRSPTRYQPWRHPDAARRARDRVLAELAARGVATWEEAEAARGLALPAAPMPAPFAAPHFAQLLAERYPAAARLHSTLDRDVQRVAEEQVAARIRELRRQGIENAAVVVIDTRTRAVRALVGSAGFFDPTSAGQVNGAAARRSPGSTLKPLLYALAFDRGDLVPASFVLDVPTDFAGYVAENFDGVYRGQVTAREALIQSLNASAVRVLARTGVADFLDLLRRGGLATLDRRPGEYGLPLVLGAGEVTLLDLTNLYATLAEGGLHRPWRLLEVEAGKALGGERLFSAEAAHLVTEVLMELGRPDLPESWRLARDVPAVAWKTGTSYGHRDAWSIGYSGRFTIGVWVGNFDGRPQKGISGARHAAPLLFDLFRAIEPAGSRPPMGSDGLAARLDLTEVEVCELSHHLPGPDCPGRTRIVTLAGRTRLPRCAMHQRMLVDAETGERLAGACLETRPYRARVVTVYPPELVAWWRAEGRDSAVLPVMSARCVAVTPGAGPEIVSPNPATPYRLRREAPDQFQQIPLIARSPSAAGRLYWFQDGTLVATGSVGQPVFLRPERGRHRLVVVDEGGRSAAVRYRVE